MTSRLKPMKKVKVESVELLGDTLARVTIHCGKQVYTLGIYARLEGLAVDVIDDETGDSVVDQEWSWNEINGE